MKHCLYALVASRSMSFPVTRGTLGNGMLERVGCGNGGWAWDKSRYQENKEKEEEKNKEKKGEKKKEPGGAWSPRTIV